MSEQEIIARLHRNIKTLEEERDAVIFTYNQADSECARLRVLVARAADALEATLPPLDVTWIPATAAKAALIADLRKEV